MPIPQVIVENPIRWEAHVKNWTDCHRCPLHLGRNHVVMYRGRLPCDVLFIGEAPGEVENSLAFPFVGPSGKLLDAILREALGISTPPTAKMGKLGEGWDWPVSPSFGVTNIVGCWPHHKLDTRLPETSEIEKCRPRLQDIIMQAQPRKIVTVGQVARKNLPPNLPPIEPIVHPAYILRITGAQARELAIKRAVATLRRVFQEVESLG